MWERWGGDAEATETYRVGPRLLFLAALVFISVPATDFLMEFDRMSTTIGFAIYLVFAFLAYRAYRWWMQDMVALTALLFGAIVMLTFAFINWFDADNAFTFLLIGFLVIGMAVGATVLLRQWAKSEEVEV